MKSTYPKIRNHTFFKTHYINEIRRLKDTLKDSYLVYSIHVCRTRDIVSLIDRGTVTLSVTHHRSEGISKITFPFQRNDKPRSRSFLKRVDIFKAYQTHSTKERINLALYKIFPREMLSVYQRSGKWYLTSINLGAGKDYTLHINPEVEGEITLYRNAEICYG